MIYQIEKLLKDNGDQLDPESKGELETAKDELKAVLDKGDLEEIKRQNRSCNPGGI